VPHQFDEFCLKMNSTNVKRQVINELNEKYGADLLNYEKCKQIYEQLKKEKAYIENELNLSDTSSIGRVVKDAKTVKEKVGTYVEQSERVIKEVEINLIEIEDVRRDMQERLDKLHALECTLQYMKVVQKIEFLRLVAMNFFPALSPFCLL
jgi:DNA repair ATPase RecN